MKGFGGGGGMQALMRQANQMQAKMKKTQEELAAREFTGTSGGDAVTAVVMGDHKVKSIEIKPEVMTAGDREMLELTRSIERQSKRLATLLAQQGRAPAKRRVARTRSR